MGGNVCDSGCLTGSIRGKTGCTFQVSCGSLGMACRFAGLSHRDFTTSPGTYAFNGLAGTQV
jgi:hypothetical protein